LILDGKNTQAHYNVIKQEKLDLHFERAKKQGAIILLPFKQEPHGKGYTCKDLEGHIWSFKNYKPFK